MGEIDQPLSREELLETLRTRVGHIRQGGAGGAEKVIRSGRAALDQLLPLGGFERGSLVEWLGAATGMGAGTLALEVARESARGGGAIVILDRRRCFNPVAAAALGMDLQQLVVVLARNHRDELWAMDQALRCSGVAAVWGTFDRIDWRAFRRLQLAAESGEALGLLLRPAEARGEPSWSHVQLSIASQASQPGQVIVHLLRCKGNQVTDQKVVELQIEPAFGADHETRALPMVSQLAYPKTGRRSAGA